MAEARGDVGGRAAAGSLIGGTVARLGPSLRVLRGYDRHLWILYAGFVASAMGFALIVPFVSLYFHEVLGVPMSLVGTFFLTTAVTRSLFQGYAGDLSDRVGRIRLLVGGQLGRAASFALMTVAVFGGWGFWPAAAILVVSYIAGAFYQPVAGAAVADLAPRERRLEAFALMRVAHNLGWGVGPMLGGFVAGIGYGWLFLVGAVTSLLSAFLVGRFVPETRVAPACVPETARERQSWRDLLELRHDRRLLLLCALLLLVFIAMSQWLSTLSVYAADRFGVSASRLGLMFGLNGFMVVTLQLAVTRAFRRMSLIGVILTGALVYAVSFFGLVFADRYAHLVLFMAAITLGELIVIPPAVTLVSLISPEGRTGRYMGVFGLTTSFGWSAGPFIGGVLLDLWGNRPLLLWGAISVLPILAAAGLWRVRRLFPRGTETAAGLS